jgi:hypothetical protein
MIDLRERSPWEALSGLAADDGRLPASWRGRPRSFAALMALYDSNHLRLVRLAGDLRSLAGQRRSRVVDDCDLELRVLERSPYTTQLELTYVFGAEHDMPSGWSKSAAGRRATITRSCVIGEPQEARRSMSVGPAT